MTTTPDDIARRFNDATKLEYINLASKPPLYKVYPGLRAIPLPDPAAGAAGPALPTLSVIRGGNAAAGIPARPDAGIADSAAADPGRPVPLTAAQLSRLLYYGRAVIRRRQLRDGEVHYRAAASAGALYPTEVYLVCGDLDGLRAGVYHYHPRDAALARLRNATCAAGWPPPPATTAPIRRRWYSPPFSGAVPGNTASGATATATGIWALWPPTCWLRAAPKMCL